jgi:hypothetical protein
MNSVYTAAHVHEDMRLIALCGAVVCVRACVLCCAVQLLLNLVFGYALYILEREAQPDDFTFPISVYVMTQVLLTGWATDTYDDYNPVTYAGKYTCIFATVAGLFLTAYMIGTHTSHRTAQDSNASGSVADSAVPRPTARSQVFSLSRWCLPPLK